MIVRSLLFTCLAGVVSLSASRLEAQQASPPAAADADRTEEAKALFAAGRAAFDAGRFADALDYFERSYAISKRPGLLYNIGITRDRLRDDERALEAYDAYLAALPDAPNRAEAETRAAAIRAALAQRKESSPAPVVAPSPAEAAATMQPSQPETLAAVEGTEHPSDDSSSVFERWWFWTAIGAVVAGGVVVGVVAASGGDEEPAEPLQPRGGVIVTTLGGGQ